MNIMNCKVGMKVTTVGDSMESLRSNSNCCAEEKRQGFVYIKKIYKDSVRVCYSMVHGTHTRFNVNSVHPYFGGKEQ
jgi:hypothetical protein